MADRTAVADALKKVLGNTYSLYVKTHAYHWNVTGPNFASLHAMFMEQYTAMWQSLDEIAERIRALGEWAPGSSQALAQLSDIDEGDNGVPCAETMLANLIDGHEKWVSGAEAALDIASEEGDTGTEDLLTPLIAAHEKTIWMLKATLGD